MSEQAFAIPKSHQTEEAIFLAWRLERDFRDPGKKPRKVPFMPHDPWRRARLNDPVICGSLAQAKRALVEYGGFLGARQGPRITIDIDGCVANGIVNPDAEALATRLGAEWGLSISGTGIYIYLEVINEGRLEKTKIVAGWAGTERLELRTGNAGIVFARELKPATRRPAEQRAAFHDFLRELGAGAPWQLDFDGAPPLPPPPAAVRA